MTIAWYDPTNGAVSRDKDSPLFTPLGQLLPLYTDRNEEQVSLWADRSDGPSSAEIKSYYKVIEAKLKQKNS